MRTAKDIIELLPELEHGVADDLEDQDLDFKKWETQSRDKAVRMVVRMAVCMANGGGGTVVFGVADRVQGRRQAILGVPPEIDINLLKKAVYDQTDPKIMPVFEALTVPEGTGRLLLMQIHPGLPPYTDTAGQGTIRIGKDCQPLTGTLRRKIAVETGETDYSAEPIRAALEDIFSPSAMEVLRSLAKQENAPRDLLRMEDRQLLQALGLLSADQPTRALVLLAGHEAAIRTHIQKTYWVFLHMTSDTHYDIREDRVTAIPQAIARIEELVRPFNPITTIEQGMYHFEYPQFPPIALREALMNAFSHADYRLPGPVMVKLFHDRLEISNSGGFIAGITAENILHHQPAARNPLLVEALSRLHLVNRSNLGMGRMFSAFLLEGKRPPIIHEIGESVTVTFLKSELEPVFRQFMASLDGEPLNVDELLVMRRLWRQPPVSLEDLSSDCQLSQTLLEHSLDQLSQRGLVEPASDESRSYWRLTAAIRAADAPPHLAVPSDEQLLSMLRRHPLQGVAMAAIIEETGMSRSTAKRLLEALRTDGLVRLIGKGPAAKWVIVED